MFGEIMPNLTYTGQGTTQARPHAKYILANNEDRSVSFDPAKTSHVAGWMRNAAHRISRRLQFPDEFVNEFVCGHGDDRDTKTRRLSYVPLACIGHPHADGRIRRALIVEPFGEHEPGIDDVERELHGERLIDIQNTEKALLKLAGPGPSESSGFERYLGSSQTWGTVTPVILPGRDDSRPKKSIGLVLKALGQSGYTTPVEKVSVQSEPVFAGSLMAKSYLLPNHLKPWPRVHLLLQFAEPVSGPILIGSGRHSGLGVFAMLEDWDG